MYVVKRTATFQYVLADTDMRHCHILPITQSPEACTVQLTVRDGILYALSKYGECISLHIVYAKSVKLIDAICCTSHAHDNAVYADGISIRNDPAMYCGPLVSIVTVDWNTRKLVQQTWVPLSGSYLWGILPTWNGIRPVYLSTDRCEYDIFIGDTFIILPNVILWDNNHGNIWSMPDKDSVHLNIYNGTKLVAHHSNSSTIVTFDLTSGSMTLSTLTDYCLFWSCTMLAENVRATICNRGGYPRLYMDNLSDDTQYEYPISDSLMPTFRHCHLLNGPLDWHET